MLVAMPPVAGGNGPRMATFDFEDSIVGLLSYNDIVIQEPRRQNKAIYPTPLWEFHLNFQIQLEFEDRGLPGQSVLFHVQFCLLRHRLLKRIGT